MNAPLPADEAEHWRPCASARSSTPRRAGVEDDLARLAAYLFRAPMALVSLIKHGPAVVQGAGRAGRGSAAQRLLLPHAILGRGPMVVPDAAADTRFAANPRVTGGPKIRFYAGAPLVDPQGHALGTLCVLDAVPRTPEAAQLEALEALARLAAGQLELRRAAGRRRAEEALRESEAKYRGLFENAVEGIYRTTPEGRYLDANPAVGGMYGSRRGRPS